MYKNSPWLLLQLKHYAKELKGFAMFPQGEKKLIYEAKKNSWVGKKIAR